MLRKIAPAMAFLLAAGAASATNITNSYTFLASGNNSGGAPIQAQADLTLDFTNLTLTVKLTNLLSNSSGVGQNITGFDFQLLNSLGQNMNPGCTATAGTTDCLKEAVAPSTVSVASGGSFIVTNSPVDPKWAFTLTNGVFLLNGLGGANNPAYSIIGAPGGTTYSAAGGSIAGNGPHNPFLDQTATWTFSIPNLVSGVTPAHIVFSFNTSAGVLFSCDSHPAGCDGGGGAQPTPEPLSFVLVGSGLIGLYFVRRRR